jgi:hypothetical protein
MDSAMAAEEFRFVVQRYGGRMPDIRRMQMRIVMRWHALLGDMPR